MHDTANELFISQLYGPNFAASYAHVLVSRTIITNFKLIMTDYFKKRQKYL